YDVNESSIYLGKNRMTDYDILRVSGLCFTDGEVPYMDTFYRYRIVKDRLDISHRDCNGSYDGTLDSTDGHIDGRCYCEYCEDSYNENEMVTVGDNLICEGCIDNNFFHCDRCAEYHPSDDCIMVTTHREHRQNTYVCDTCIETYYQCAECDDHFNENEIVSVDDTDSVCTKCAEQDATLCEDCDKWYSEATEVDGKAVCNDCLEEYLICCKCDGYFTIYDIVESANEHVCTKCAGLEDCKGQDRFDLDDPSEIRPNTKFSALDIEENLKEMYSSYRGAFDYGTMRPTWCISEVSA
ncbi:hypothetical protein LCGC14_2488860, partial [marine sediment metagenome]